jgi:DNA polymerase-3 subunit epsilon
LTSALHYFVLPVRAIPETSAVIHGITDDRAAQGRPLREVLPQLLALLAGRVLIAHHASIEHQFLDAACRRLYQTPFLARIADTEVLLRRWLDQRLHQYQPGELRLHALRQRYGLPQYRAHDALFDALSAAELFCAYVAHRGLRGSVPLRLLLTSG